MTGAKGAAHNTKRFLHGFRLYHDAKRCFEFTSTNTKLDFPLAPLLLATIPSGTGCHDSRFSRVEVAVGVGMFSADSCFFLISCTAHMSLHAYAAFSHTKTLLLCTLQKCLPLPYPSAVLSCTAATHTNTKATVISGTQEHLTLSNLFTDSAVQF